jgi:hypothetical protein
MKTKDSLLLENAYEIIQIKQFLLSEGYSINEIEQAITEGKLSEFLDKAKKAAANIGVAATLGATALGFGNSLANNTNQTQQSQQPQISLNSKVAAENPVFLQAFKYITGKDFQNTDSEFGTMYVIYHVLSKVGGNGGVNAKTLADTIKNEIGQNSNSVNTQDTSKLDGTVKSILSKTQNLPKQQATGGKFGDPTVKRNMVKQLR